VFVESDEFETSPPMDRYPGWAKRMGELQVQAYKEQYGLQYSVVRPSNVYGPGDNFDPESAMVIPTLMARIARGDDPVLVWGDGAAIRDFAYADDVAEGIVRAMHFGTRTRYVNLGSGVGVSIKELIETLAEFLEFAPHFDVSKPSGYPRRVMSIEQAQEQLGYEPAVSLRQGLERTWEWFQANRDQHLKKQNYLGGA
jgi:GDP-L-fucose synthase